MLIWLVFAVMSRFGAVPSYILLLCVIPHPNPQSRVKAKSCCVAQVDLEPRILLLLPPGAGLTGVHMHHRVHQNCALSRSPEATHFWRNYTPLSKINSPSYFPTCITCPLGSSSPRGSTFLFWSLLGEGRVRLGFNSKCVVFLWLSSVYAHNTAPWACFLSPAVS